MSYDPNAGSGGGLQLTVITPAALAADVNNYNPAGFGPNVLIRQDVTGVTQEITGFDSTLFSDGDVFYISNISAAENLKITADSGLSLFANRVIVTAAIQIDRTGATGIWFDGTTGKFRPLTERT